MVFVTNGYGNSQERVWGQDLSVELILSFKEGSNNQLLSENTQHSTAITRHGKNGVLIYSISWTFT